ncbi:MAG: DUF6282 family protein [Cyclobacteriaceae bacterium]
MRNLFFVFMFFVSVQASYGQKFDIQVFAEFNVGTSLGQLRAVPVQCGDKARINLLFVYSEDKEIDPFRKMFFFPTSTLKLAMYTPEGKKLWVKELHKGNIPGTWFIPVFPFDLDQDGKEEIWFVHNTDEEYGKFVWFPTIDAACHKKAFGMKSVGGISILDKKQKLLPEVLEIIDIIYDDDLVLALGHISTDEIDVLVK